VRVIPAPVRCACVRRLRPARAAASATHTRGRSSLPPALSDANPSKTYRLLVLNAAVTQAALKRHRWLRRRPATVSLAFNPLRLPLHCALAHLKRLERERERRGDVHRSFFWRKVRRVVGVRSAAAARRAFASSSSVTFCGGLNVVLPNCCSRLRVREMSARRRRANSACSSDIPSQLSPLSPFASFIVCLLYIYWWIG
jgi:hypothetical protein